MASPKSAPADLEREYSEYTANPTPTRKTRVKMVAYTITYNPSKYTKAEVSRALAILAEIK